MPIHDPHLTHTDLSDPRTLRGDLQRIAGDPREARAAVDALLGLLEDLLHGEEWSDERELCRKALAVGAADGPDRVDPEVMARLAGALIREHSRDVLVGVYADLGPPAAESLDPILDASDSRHCHAALMALRGIDPLPAAFSERLEDLLGSRDVRVRGAAARCLLAQGVQEVRLATPLIAYAADGIERSGISNPSDPGPFLSDLTSDLLRIGPDVFEPLARADDSDHPAFSYWIQSTLALLESIYIA